MKATLGYTLSIRISHS